MFESSKFDSIVFGIGTLIGLVILLILIISVPLIIIYAIIHLLTGWTI